MASLRERIKEVFRRSANKTQKVASVPQQRNGIPKTHQRLTQQDGTADNLKTQDLTAMSTPGTIQFKLQNQTTSNVVYAYITGLDLDNNNAVFLLQANGRDPYYPSNPSSTGTKISVDVSIPLGPPGNTVTCTIPRIAGGRIWFAIDNPLTFAVNPGPGLVEPSIFNPSDPNINTKFGFCEFTHNASQLFVNITYVDFVGPPIALTLTDTSGMTQHISGMSARGLQACANHLVNQTARDGQPWSSLVVNDKNGNPLRILSPNSGILLNPNWFKDYWTDYVNRVYAQYRGNKLTINTQASFGNVTGQVGPQGNLNFGSGSIFQKPTAADIFSCSTGPFATGQNAQTNVIIPRLAAAFNRSTLLLANDGTTTPNGTTPAQYYTVDPTNHYARIVHAENLDGKGYAFPYDDVTGDGGDGQEGAVFSFSPQLLTVAVGGTNAFK